MSFARGERVYFDFDSGDIEPAGVEPPPSDSPSHSPVLASAFVGDILERPVGGAAQPPIAPSFNANANNGFPLHKKRTSRASVFKRERAGNGDAKVRPAAGVRAEGVSTQTQTQIGRMDAEDKGKNERSEIDEENRQRLANMSSEEIEREQRELLESLSPSLIQKLLGRANLDDGRNEVDWDNPVGKIQKEEGSQSNKAEEKEAIKKVSFAEPEPELEPEPDDRNVPPAQPVSAQPLSAQHEPSSPTDTTSKSLLAVDIAAEMVEEHDSIHFPRPTQPPDLDPHDPSFLQNLHKKYFPNLSYDPSTLSWMTPIDPSDTKSPYHPSHTAYNPKDLRFDFRGALLAPSTAREIPVTEGLHHHADAPEAAGYTVAELAIMARSSVAAQRCVAFQTLGRFLYRLGRGEFGVEKVRRKTGGPVQVARNPNVEEEVDEDEIEVDMLDAGSAIASGLWKEVDEGKVVETLTEEAQKESGHLSSRTFAQEALWCWRRGGGRKRMAI